MISSSWRKLSGYRKYQRTHTTIISASKCRLLNSVGRSRLIGRAYQINPRPSCNATYILHRQTAEPLTIRDPVILVARKTELSVYLTLREYHMARAPDERVTD